MNICNKDSEVVVIQEKLNRQLSSGLTPLPTANAPVPMTQEDLHLDSRIEGQPDTLVVPFQSDEQPIKVENNSVISAAHEEAVQIFDGSPE